MRIVVALLMLLIGSCAPAVGQSPGSPTATETDESRACIARGGTMRRVCLMGTLACVEPYPDAGKPCRDKSDCRGQCRYTAGPLPPVGAQVVGTCQASSDPCGCFATVMNGKLQPMLCVD